MSSPSSNKPINQFFTGLEAEILAKSKYKPGMLVESIYAGYGDTFTISPTPRFEYITSHGYLYVDGMAIFNINTQQWARIISGAKDPITKDQKEHILNLIKSI